MIPDRLTASLSLADLLLLLNQSIRKLKLKVENYFNKISYRAAMFVMLGCLMVYPEMTLDCQQSFFTENFQNLYLGLFCAQTHENT